VSDRYARYRNLHDLVASEAYRAEVDGLAERMRDEGIEAVYLTFPSVDGRMLAKLVRAERFRDVARRGIRLHPGSISDARADLDGALIGFAESEVEAVGVPDPSTFSPLPWAPRMARVLCFIYDESTGAPLDHDSRGNLLRLEHAFETATGLRMLCSIEPEMTWLTVTERDGPQLASKADAVYSYANFREFEPLIGDVLDTCSQMGIRVHGIDSEESSQLEVNQVPTTPLAHADAIFTYRQICSAVGARHGLRCTFMPKPFIGESGNGAHHNLSLVDADGTSAMTGDRKGACRLSQTGSEFLGGLLEHIDAMTFVGAPSVNSYKRFWDEGHWAPFAKSFGYNNRTCLVRVAPGGRIELRHFDSSSNPYHTLACCLAAGRDGLTRHLDPGEPTTGDAHSRSGLDRAERIPLTPVEAADAFRSDALMREVFPPRLYDVLLALRADEWRRYWNQVSTWELDFYLARWS
jgi:glutamine synthetase